MLTAMAIAKKGAGQSARFDVDRGQDHLRCAINDAPATPPAAALAILGLDGHIGTIQALIDWPVCWLGD